MFGSRRQTRLSCPHRFRCLAATCMVNPCLCWKRRCACQPTSCQLGLWLISEQRVKAVLRLNKVAQPNLLPAEQRETEAQFGPIWGRAEADAYYRALQREYKVQYLNEGKKVTEAVTAAKK